MRHHLAETGHSKNLLQEWHAGNDAHVLANIRLQQARASGRVKGPCIYQPSIKIKVVTMQDGPQSLRLTRFKSQQAREIHTSSPCQWPRPASPLSHSNSGQPDRMHDVSFNQAAPKKFLSMHNSYSAVGCVATHVARSLVLPLSFLQKPGAGTHDNTSPSLFKLFVVVRKKAPSLADCHEREGWSHSVSSLAHFAPQLATCSD